MNTLDDLLAIIPFDDLVEGIGALQLMPENADHLGRLEYLANLIVERQPTTDWQPPASSEQWARLLNELTVIPEDVIRNEDPFNYPFTESFPFIDGTHTALGGLAEAGSFLTRMLSDVVFRSDPSPGTRAFRQWSGRLLLAVLYLGDEIARRAVLGRGVPPKRSADGHCNVPAPERFEELKHAVTFTDEELADLLDRTGCSLVDLDHLIIRSRLAVAPTTSKESKIIAHPILRIADRFIVISPGNLLTAARHAIISKAVADGFGSALGTAYRNIAFTSVYASLERMGMRCLRTTVPNRPGQYVEGIFSFDADKIAHVLLTSDPLTNWNPEVVFGDWDASELSSSIPAFQSAARTKIFSMRNRVENVLHLTIIAGIGRTHFIGYNPLEHDTRCLTLNMSPENLEVLSWLPDTQQLTLWQFAQAQHNVERHARIIAFDPLDEYGFYRSNRCSYYATDDSRPSMMSLVPDFAESLRCEAHNRADRLAVFHPDLGQVIEIFNSHSERRVPIHCTLPGTGLPYSLHVGGLPLSVWVVFPNTLPDARYTALHMEFADMVTYWIWQLTPGLLPYFMELPEQTEWIVIELVLQPGEEWFSLGGDLTADNTLSTSYSNHERIRLTIGSGLATRLASSNNAGEREVMRAVLCGLRDWGQRFGVPSLGNVTDLKLRELLDKYVPLGLQKKMLLLNADKHPELNNAGLPKYRPIQAFDQQQVFDAVGHIAGWHFGTEPEEIPDDQRIGLLNKLVTQLFDDLERLVASLAPDGLLNALVAQNERVIYEQEFRRFVIPTRLACYGEHTAVIEHLSNELPKAASAGIAGRFLIEYVTARPPSGNRRFSLSVYDRLLALSAQIIDFGMSSDALRYQLSNCQFEMLRSGRLAFSQSQYESAMDDFRETYAREVAGRSHTAFEGHWADQPALRSSVEEQLIGQMDKAALAEFGFSLLELNQFLAEVMWLGLDLPGEPKSLQLGAFIDRLAGSLNWNKEWVTQAVELFALRRRLNFLTPPDGFNFMDVYPWRFNRGLSHVRRPLLVRSGTDGEEVIWGVRTVRMSANYLTSLCVGGRLIARTRVMRQAMGAFHEHHGRMFNQRVAELYRNIPGLLVRERVKKIGRLRIARKNGQDLGDLDVLVADPHERILIPVETKDLNAALTPPELRNEMNGLFGAADGKAGDLDRFAERVDWVQSNVEAVLEHQFGILNATGWAVCPMLVLDREMISPLLARRVGLIVLSARQLQDLLEHGSLELIKMLRQQE